MTVAARVRVALLVALAACCAGCGLSPKGSGAVTVRVTRNFGATPIRTVSAGKVSNAPSDLTLLRDHLSVDTHGAGTGVAVTAVAGHARASGETWSLFVNGVNSAKDVAQAEVKRGDHIWLDLHDSSRASTIPAVVGSFPEPFAHGIGGRRYPSTIECGSVKAACSAVSATFAHLHIPLSDQLLGTGSGPDTLSVNVGLWSELAPEVAAELIDYGPGASGVYAHFADHGRRLQLLDGAGRVVRTLGPDAGLIAATADKTDVPTWLVAGTDRAGTLAAARALTAPALAGHYALAVQGGHTYPVPDGG